MDKGIIFSLVFLLLSLNILTFAVFYSSLQYSFDHTSHTVNYIFSDVQSDLKDIYGISAKSYNPGSTSIVVISDYINMTPNLVEYNNYLQNQYYQKTLHNASLSQTDSSIFILEPAEWFYSYPDLNKEKIWIYPGTDEVNLKETYINAFFDSNFINVTEETSNGPMKTIINISFANHNYYDTPQFSRTQLSNITFNTDQGQVILLFGNVNIQDTQKTESFEISYAGQKYGLVKTALEFQGSNEIRLHTNNTLNVYGETSRHSKPVLSITI